MASERARPASAAQDVPQPPVPQAWQQQAQQVSQLAMFPQAEKVCWELSWSRIEPNRKE